ncbi:MULTISPECIES: hypothetical protein [Ramlibacter]|uniref:DUF4345 domain-containing protein n=1 Tax=Ramlibacter rhizophilus TaxID=1781167 RepID=A0A4Z0BI68_9BURK|nr:hypothetical protein [Ramlibacter rhizophilus]TFY98470.1 hypothetical protein EZ242_13070 [Ramlibacter rhizophilus]
MSFSTIAVVTAVAAILLGLAWLFAGGLLLRRWGIEPSPTGLLIGRRIGCIYLGLAALLLMVRATSAPEARWGIAAGFAVALSLLALIGIFELIAKRAKPGILSSVALEALLAAGFISSMAVTS